MSQNPGKRMSEVEFKYLKPGDAFVSDNGTKAVIEEASLYSDKKYVQIVLRCENNRLLSIRRSRDEDQRWHHIESIE